MTQAGTLQHKQTNKFNFVTIPCVLLSMVNTQPTNKDTHPGYWDLPSALAKQAKSNGVDVTLEQQKHAIQNIATIKKDLLTKQWSSSTNARQLHRPGGTKQQPVSKGRLSTANANITPGTYFISCD